MENMNCILFKQVRILKFLLLFFKRITKGRNTMINTPVIRSNLSGIGAQDKSSDRFARREITRNKHTRQGSVIPH